ncbi:nuclear transcription factor Y subunit C-2 [Selaginella moellendorffii]|uniref:nuclear transcription factor Y subunit C-2 n=1 Tax=Selaginella moellendorffii TaxID=88036 RepID=UPI000D1C645C|nr:nuclear transcription factor Y subunit C-2 [Selaginella moellendorffii]|eukprot:XP_024542637.1 nuclear transcription factor Y subunit C-2 [Selaginella moellendorffii]
MEQHQATAPAIGQPMQAGFPAPPGGGAPGTPMAAGQVPGAAQSAVAFQQALGYQQMQQQHQQQLQQFWQGQMQEIEQVNDFKNHQLPLARIKKIMKADEDVRMISAEAPVLFAKACEMFILELTLRSWIHTEENKRRTLQKNDIAAAITRTDIFDFLVDIVPRDELKEETLGVTRAAMPVGPPGDPMQYPGLYYVPPAAQGQAAAGASPLGSPVVGRPAMPVDPAMFSQQRQQGIPGPYMTQQQMWPQQPATSNSSGAPASSS